MWNTSITQGQPELVCYVFHHFSGSVVDRSEIVVSDCGYAREPSPEADENGLPTWFLFRSIPIRLCPRAGDCGQCSYALGEVAFSSVQQLAWRKRRAS